ncbi:TPA: type II toxin-antitoxin system RelE/ParE family toxin [Escherichia coli]|nr:type II toxin-antitoxin system RelE/ParE family toxin [Escherichia coli]EFT6969782.1 type II toxin-antitoxin system RelE/ParE family toxin [Escherichia coli]EHK3786615.1 type II toxin-antitoxin system RelE/ParE family toxin [Escherichia coli]EHK6816504.1 type II toxin-antitoxin system RelE/ParE family toxin [Escherichia coli]EHK7184537.1 type II toxin-antitoxin system RelE/ParE family toxin [Escherichia coli]
MGVYKARRFSQSTKKLGIHDKVLMAAAEEVMQGIWEADLGSGVIKKRLPLQQGKSGLSSKGTKEIEDDELAAYKKMANAFLAFSNKQIEDLIETGFLIEVKNER